MQTRDKWLMLLYVIVACAAVTVARDVYEPEVIRDAAIAQMQPNDESVQTHRALDRAKHALDWVWVAVPVAAVLLFGGDVVRVATRQRGMS